MSMRFIRPVTPVVTATPVRMVIKVPLGRMCLLNWLKSRDEGCKDVLVLSRVLGLVRPRQVVWLPFARDMVKVVVSMEVQWGGARLRPDEQRFARLLQSLPGAAVWGGQAGTSRDIWGDLCLL
ncbi:UNVERIFIED_CONTAM: hypothetical protein HHA_215955 [Hammondia hammondi]|eukprot:XP_008886336.1 hypothetical protein HHA_215955 [Hammondia hammondi]